MLALETTLELYRDGLAEREVPVVTMITAPREALQQRAEALAHRCRTLGADAARLSVRPSPGKIGGGAQPMAELPGYAVVLSAGSGGADDLEAALRAGDPPILARVQDDAVWLDVRTLTGDDEVEIVAGVVARLTGSG